MDSKTNELDFLEDLSKFKLVSDYIGKLTKDIWKIALNPSKSKAKNKAPKGNGQPIFVGDIIKIGWIKLKLKEMKFHSEQQTFSENS